MSRPYKTEKRKAGPAVRTRSERQGWRIFSRRSFGHTEKILRRNRQLWARLFSKEGRQFDRAAVKESLGDPQ